MRTSKIISGALAVVMAASTLAIGGVAASAATLKAPTNVQVVNTTNTLRITWKKVAGAKKYKIYRGKKLYHTTTKVKYYDNKAKAGKKYTYCVKAVKGKTVSKASKKVSATRLKKTTVTVKAVTGGIKASWKAVKGASKYDLYRKTTGKKYSKIATLKSKTYTDQKATSGIKYTYKVKAVKGTSSSASSEGKSATYLAPVETAKFTADKPASKLTLTWNIVKGATGYTVYDGNTNAKIADVTEPKIELAPETKNIDVVNYTIVATKGSVKSEEFATAALFIPAGSYFTDPADNTVHAVVKIKAGEKYTAGSYGNAVEPAPTVTQLSGEDVATIDKDFNVTGVKAGTAQFKVEYDGAVKDLLNAYFAETNYSFQNDLSAGVAYLDLTVE